MCSAPQWRAIFRHLKRQKWSKHAVLCTFWLANVLFATAAYNFWTSELQKVVPDPQFFNIFTSECALRHSGVTSEQTKVVQTCGVLYILTFKCAFRHSGVQFFDIWTDKSAPNPSCFVHFDFQNVLFATAACNFWFLLGAPTSAPAALTGLLFDWPDTRIIEKTQHFATSLTFCADVSSFFWLSRYCIFCRLTWRPQCGAMHLVFNCPYCRKFLFKLPSMINEQVQEQGSPKFIKLQC